MQTYHRQSILYAAKAVESILADDADDWNLVHPKKQSKIPVHDVDQKAKATIPKLYAPMSALADCKVYYLKYSTIMKL